MQRSVEERIKDLEQAMTELVQKLNPILTDYEYDKRRRTERRESMRDWRIVLGIVFAIPLFVESVAQLAARF